MSRRAVYLLLAAAFALAACEMESGEGTVVGSPSDQVIAGLTFTVDTTYVDGSGGGTLVAKGKVRNAGNSTATSPWYVEGQFYTDRTKQLKLGGNYVRIGVPLGPGQGTLWTLTFSSSANDVRQYPGFTVGDLRGIYKQ